MNVFTFVGRLGKDCRVTSGSTTMCSFPVAVRSGYGEREQTLWIDCTLFGKRAEGRLPEYLVKGAQVAVSGELGTREYDGKTYLTCRVNDLDLVGDKRDSGPQQTRASAPKKPDLDDDIPF